MGQSQQKRRAGLIVEDDAEPRSLTAALFEDEQTAEIVRFAWMWMSLAEPIDETRGSYEFPRGR